MKGALEILLEMAGGKGFGHLPFDAEPLIWTCLDMHDMYKRIDYIGYLAKKENNQEVMKLVDEAQEKLRKVNKDLTAVLIEYRDQEKAMEKISEVTGENLRTKEDLQLYNQKMTERLASIKKVTSIVNPPENLMGVVMNMHSAEKLTAELEGVASREGLKEVEALCKRLDGAFTDIYNVMHRNKDGSKTSAILKKYAHNIPSVIKDNDMILTLKNGIDDKNLLGNKGANLVTMHKLGVNVPQSLFLTTKLVKSIRDTGNIDSWPFLKQILFMFPEDKIAVRSSGVISMAGMMDTVLDIDKNDDEAVKKAIMDVVASWDSPRARQYRKMCKVEDEIKLAIVIQPVIRGDKGYSGVCFSRDVNTGKPTVNGEYLKGQLGDALVSGKATPQPFTLGKFPCHIYAELAEAAQKLEKHFKAVQDIEFVNDGKATYIVQTRNAKLSDLAKVRILIDFCNEGIITSDDFKAEYEPRLLDGCKEFEIISEGFIGKGLGVSNGVATGTVTFNKSTANHDNILIADDTTPDDLPCMAKVKGIVTRIGGKTSHPAVICREQKKPCIVGADALQIDKLSGIAMWGLKELREGDVITIIGNNGHVHYGKAMVKETVKYEKEVNEILNQEE